MAKWWERLPRANLALVRIRPGVWFFRLRLFPFSGSFSLGLRLSSVYAVQFHIRRPQFQQWKGIIFLIDRFFDYVICKWLLHFHSAALASDDTDTEQADDLEKVKANIWNFLWVFLFIAELPAARRAAEQKEGEARGNCARHDLSPPPAANTYITTVTRKWNSLMVFSHKLNFL